MGKLADHVTALNGIGNASVAVGWFAENRYPSGIPVAAVAAHNEFGTMAKTEGGEVQRIPPRPLLRTSAEKAKDLIADVATKLSDRVLDGTLTADQAMSQVGEKVIEAISDTLKSNTFAPNADSTAAAKGFNKPLVHHGTLGETVQYKVNYDDSGE